MMLWMAKYMLVITLQFTWLKVSHETVCRESEIWVDIGRRKPDYVHKMKHFWTRPPSSRSLFQSLRNCTIYHGDIVINDHSTDKDKFEEDIRYEDLQNLANLQRIYGRVQLELRKFPGITNLSFLSNLKEVRTRMRRGFSLMYSQVEVLGFTEFRLRVPYAVFAFNPRLCFMEHFETVNATTSVALLRNAAPAVCAREGRECSASCNPRKGCWGPDDRHCFDCGQWRAGEACVDVCASRGFFAPSRGRVCGACHASCRRGCFGPDPTQCFSPADLDCPATAFRNGSRCQECSDACLGRGSRALLTTRACSGPGERPGPGGCSTSCRGMTVMTISSRGELQCSPCHANCLEGCHNTSLSGCFQLKPPETTTTPAPLETTPGPTPETPKRDQTMAGTHHSKINMNSIESFGNVIQMDKGELNAIRSSNSRQTSGGQAPGETSGGQAPGETSGGQVREQTSGGQIREQTSGGQFSGWTISLMVLCGVSVVVLAFFMYIGILRRLIKGMLQYREVPQPSTGRPSNGRPSTERARQRQHREVSQPSTRRPSNGRPSNERARQRQDREVPQPSPGRPPNGRPSNERPRQPRNEEPNGEERPPNREMNRPVPARRPVPFHDLLAAPGDVFLALPLRAEPRRYPGRARRLNPAQEGFETELDERWSGRRGWSRANEDRVVICTGGRRTILRIWSSLSNDAPPGGGWRDPSFDVW